MKILEFPYSKNYIQNRVDRFHEEFLSNEQSHENIEKILATIHDYLLMCVDDEVDPELFNGIVNLRQSIFWIQQWSDVDEPFHD